MNHGLPSDLPKARTENLIVKELPDETLIYDLQRDEAHCLNHTAALVWKYCDGSRTVIELRDCLKNKLGPGVRSEVVWLALSQLEEFKLLEAPLTRPTHLAGISRRHLLRNLGLTAAVTIPLITSIVAPTPAQAASNLPRHAFCCAAVDTCAPPNTCGPHPNSGACNQWCE